MPHRAADDKGSVVFNDMAEVNSAYTGADTAKWDRLMAMREDVKKALELARGEKIIGASLESCVTLYAEGELCDFIEANLSDLPGVFIASEVKCVRGAGEGVKGEVVPGLTIQVAASEGVKCERCWKYTHDVGSDSDHPTLCARCASVVKAMN